MAIGLTGDELSHLFVEEFKKATERLDIDKIVDTTEFMAKGLSQQDARVQATLGIRHEATIRAFIAILETNNHQIESQLKSRGL